MSITRIPRLAADLMTTDVVTLDENDTLDHLDAAMRAMRFRHMPVVDGGRLVGLLTQHDLLRASASSLSPSRSAQDKYVNEHFRVRDIMTRDVHSVSPATTLIEVAEDMITRKLACVPVVDVSNRLIGLITEGDFVRLSLQLLRT